MTRSKYDILNSGYGVLNPEVHSLTGKNYNPDDNSAGFFSQGVKAVQDILGSSKMSNFNGPMVGICLRNEGRVSQSGWIDPTCWAALSSDIIEEGSQMDLVQIRVRVPELHAEKPIPNDLPEREKIDKNHDIINQYPLFISQHAGVSEPVAGDLVWIDFQDRSSKIGGIFLGVAETGFAAKSEGESVGSPSEAFKRKGRKTELDAGKITYEDLKEIWEPLTDLISETESGGNYNAAFGNFGKPPSNTSGFKDYFTKDLVAMTINEAIEYGKFYRDYWRSKRPGENISSAIGRWQQIASNIYKRLGAAGLRGEDTFNQENQDRIMLMSNIMVSRGGESWLEGGEHSPSDGAFMIRLSAEWSSLPAYKNKYAYAKHKTGPNEKWFYYEGQGTKHKTPADVEEALQEVRKNYEEYLEDKGEGTS